MEWLKLASGLGVLGGMMAVRRARGPTIWSRLPVQDQYNKTVIVTGASVGIGM